jgi:hypothetical protein
VVAGAVSVEIVVVEAELLVAAGPEDIVYSTLAE